MSQYRELMFETKPVAVLAPETVEKAQEFCEGYKAFLNRAKTEREAAREMAAMLQKAGYTELVPGRKYAPGDKVYRVYKNKCVLAATVGSRPLEEGMHINASHIDNPRLDLRPMPLYQSGDLALFKTHYYGGVRKYQWATIPLALHGVVYKADGSRADVCIGEDPEDPVFCITDLLPHISAEQNERRLPDGIRGEELNVLAGGLPVPDADAKDEKDRVRQNVLRLLNLAYGMTEKDFVRAELEVVPAFRAADVGLDRSMVGGYGQDDKVEAYPALMAEIHTKDPAYTTLCILTDKEEIGSEGVTSMKSQYFEYFVLDLCRGAGADHARCLDSSRCISADVTSAYDPTWSSAFAPGNCAYAGRGIAVYKYTGARGKSAASDASAEMVAYVLHLLEQAGVTWQVGELGRIDLGGGGTVAKFVANRGIETLDMGVPVLSMHSPFEVVAKTDVYMAYLAFSAFNSAKE